jgi:hypothetical protein
MGETGSVRRIEIAAIPSAVQVALLVLAAGCGLGAASRRAQAQPPPPPDAGVLAKLPEPAPPPPPPTGAREVGKSEASLQTTGQFRLPGSVEQIGSAIRPADRLPVPAKSDERTVAARGEPSEVSQELAAPVMALDSNMPARVNELLACRLEIAVDRKTAVSRVLAGTLLLRWTVRPEGAVADPEVVALKDTDPEVLACVKRKMSEWLFTRPAGSGSLRVEQHLRFQH